MRLKIKVPATTSNIGPGFDCLGLAFNLYNEFYFEESKTWEFVGFDEAYANTDNLVVQSMIRAYEYSNQESPCYKISIIQNIPVARGLGSSATCIVAGIMAANHYLDNIYTKNDILNIANMIEGHPDNASPAIFGSLIASYLQDEDVRYVKYPVSDTLKFTLAIPSFSMSTKLSRAALPKSLEYKDIIHNLSRLVNIPKGLVNADIELLYELLDDRMHEPYRFPLINESNKFKQLSQKHKIPFCISGSGSALLYISKDDIVNFLKAIDLDNQWKFMVLAVDDKGAVIEVIEE